jgi:TonB family protein
MKRFLFISVLFHLLVLLLLFSWEIPPANRLLPRSVVEVSLVERIEGKPEGKKEGGDNQEKERPLKRKEVPEKKDEGTIPEAPRRITQAAAEEKREEPKQEKVEPAQKEMKEEKPSAERVLESLAVEARTEETLAIQARLAPPTGPGGEAKETRISPKGFPTSGGRWDGGATFLASAGLEPGRDGIPLGGGRKGSGVGQGEGETSRFSSVSKSSGDGDSVIAEIIRRIEKAKRYPRIARKMGTEGQATVRFRIKTDGKVEGVELLESSGSEILDQASLETVLRAAPLPYKDGWLKVIIVFKIL